MSLLTTLVTLATQSVTARHEGRLITNTSADSLWVELYESPGHQFIDRVPVSRDGSFTVNTLPNQQYEARVVTSHGNRVTSDYVQFRHGQPVEIRLPASATDAPAPAGPISALRLAYKPAKSVRRLMREAESLAEKGNLAAAADTLQRLLAADPNWFEAWNNLGARRLSIGQHAEAADAFRHALAIDPNNAATLTNLGLAQLFLHQPADAERAALRAQQLSPGAPRIAYVYGLALLQQEKKTAEALDALQKAAAVIPRALLTTAEWHCRHDDFAACEKDLQAFLRTPSSAQHAQAETWLARVKNRRRLRENEPPAAQHER